MSKRETFEKLLAAGCDDALLRFALGQACLEDDDPEAAIDHLGAAIGHDAGYSAAWKLLGRAQLEAGRADAAAATWTEGIAIAERRGDRQAGREMAVFLRRLQKSTGAA